MSIVETIIEQYKVHRLRGKQEEWGIHVAADGKFSPDNVYCCGLSVLLIGKEAFIGGVNLGNSLEQAAEVLLGLTESYVNGFMSGYDHGGDKETNWEISAGSQIDAKLEPLDKLQWNEGFFDGDATWKALDRLGMAYVPYWPDEDKDDRDSIKNFAEAMAEDDINF